MKIRKARTTIDHCTHTNTDAYTYSRYIFLLALYSNLIKAS